MADLEKDMLEKETKLLEDRRLKPFDEIYLAKLEQQSKINLL